MLQRFGETLPAREVKFAPCDLKSVEADGTFAGYASLFGEVDLGNDLVMPGAFRDSLRARGAQGIKLLFQHDPERADRRVARAARGRARALRARAADAGSDAGARSAER